MIKLQVNYENEVDNLKLIKESNKQNVRKISKPKK